MSPDGRVCDQEERRDSEENRGAPAHQGRRVQPEEPPPARAWTESEERRRGAEPGGGPGGGAGSPGENRRLLARAPRAGGVRGGRGVRKLAKRQLAPRAAALQKTKFQKRKEKLVAALAPPYFILTMIILIVCVHAWGSEAVRARLEWAPSAWWREPWRLLSYGCVHATTAHLALNAIVALAVGWRLELEQGWRRVAAVWCGGVAAGALGAGALQPRVRVVGASAAVYALLTAHLPNVCLRFGHIPLWWFRPLSVVVLAATEVSWAMLRAQPAPAARDHAAHGAQVAWAAHLLGAAAGLTLGFVAFSGENYKNRYLVASRVGSAAGLAAGALAAAAQQLRRCAGDRYT